MSYSSVTAMYKGYDKLNNFETQQKRLPLALSNCSGGRDWLINSI